MSPGNNFEAAHSAKARDAVNPVDRMAPMVIQDLSFEEQKSSVWHILAEITHLVNKAGKHHFTADFMFDFSTKQVNLLLMLM